MIILAACELTDTIKVTRARNVLERVSNRVWSRVERWFQIAIISLFAASLSYYFRDFPRQPDLATGRVYPLQNHYHVTYLTRSEWLSQYAFAGAAFIVLALGLILHYLRHRDSSADTNRK